MAVAEKLKKMVNAKSCILTNDILHKGKPKAITLSFNGIDKKNQDDRITSTLAYYFYQNDTPDIYKYEQINISVSDGSFSFKKGYNLEEIRTADSLLHFPVKEFFKWYVNDSARYVIDSRLPDSTYHKIEAIMMSTDSSYGKIDDIGFGGWLTTFLRETNEPLQVFYITATNGKYVTDYSIAVSLKTRQIVNVTLLDWPHLKS